MPRPAPRRLRLLSALLALLVLLSSVGLTAERHRCRISGRSVMALEVLGHGAEADAAASLADRACGMPRKASAGRDGCCDISHVLHKLDAKSQGGAALKAPAKALPLLLAVFPAPAWAGPLASARVAGVATGTAGGPSPPGVPRAGRVLLAWVGVLVV